MAHLGQVLIWSSLQRNKAALGFVVPEISPVSPKPILSRPGSTLSVWLAEANLEAVECGDCQVGRELRIASCYFIEQYHFEINFEFVQDRE